MRPAQLRRFAKPLFFPIEIFTVASMRPAQLRRFADGSVTDGVTGEQMLQ